MPALAVSSGFRPRKRPRHDDDPSAVHKLDTAPLYGPPRPDGMQDVKSLEDQILLSRRYYNNISTLIDYLSNTSNVCNNSRQALLALCRIFSRLMAQGEMAVPHQRLQAQSVSSQWLMRKYQHYCTLILSLLVNGTYDEKFMSLTSAMQLFKEELSGLESNPRFTSNNGIFPKIVQTLVQPKSGDEIRLCFVEEHVNRYPDIRLHTFRELAIVANEDHEGGLEGIISMMVALKDSGLSRSPTDDLFIHSPESKLGLYTTAAQKRAAQGVWMAILQSDLTEKQRKLLLKVMSHRIAPWFARPELLIDFLVDSFNVGGSTSLMALSGLFYLIQKMNLDYPQFYQKLYSVLDCYVLHSKHRSRFFRLLETFLASTHIPFVLVASFIKRLSRLCLYSPPSGTVVVVPWIYNLLKNHPTCTFMIHRQPNGTAEERELATAGLRDPFRMEEDDPMLTRAIESSLWEIETLQSHFHPNIAAIAKIISEQFTKQGYSVEDFLDHTYGSMLDTELVKTTKKTPVVEYVIPRSIFVKSADLHSRPESLVLSLWDFDG